MIASLAKRVLLFLGSVFFNNHRSKILYYHDVFDKNEYVVLNKGTKMGTPLYLFRSHINIIEREGYKIVDRITNKKNEVALMFDDGFRGIWDCRDFFFEKGIKPTVFLAVDLIGKDGYLNDSEIQELKRHGFIFQCHGWTHTNLATKTQEELKKELGESKQYLEQLLSDEVDEICLPIGFFSDFLIVELKKCGYKKAYSSVPGSFDDLILDFLVPRNLCQFSSQREVKYILRGGYEILRNRYMKLHYKQ